MTQFNFYKNLKFDWRKYCFDNSLPSQTTKIQALEHKLQNILDANNNEALCNKYEPFSLSFNYNNNIAIFCHTIPTPDIDSGSNRLIEILKILINKKYNIYYFTHSCIPENPQYHSKLYSIGVKQILCINKEKNIYCDQQYIDLVDSGINFDIVLFYFYDMYDQYIDKIKSKTPTIKTIIDSVDVHWLRLERGNYGSLIQKQKEKSAYNDADVVFAVTENDRQAILTECPQANIKILSNIHDMKIDSMPSYKHKNFLFIGGSNHTPNIDAANTAIKIFSNFIQESTETKSATLYLVGKSFTTETKNLAKKYPNIKILGHLNDAELDALYKEEIYAVLCPITWGAGIKGKICQAISYNIPVITTDIGNEGINLKHNVSGFIGNNPKELQDCIKLLFSKSKIELQKLTNNAKNTLNLLVSKDSAETVLSGTLECKKIVLSIATYNNALILERCVNSLIANTSYPNYIIHITSNGCKDNTQQILYKLQRIYGENRVRFTINEKNKHFIYAHNDVINLYNNDDIVLINNDMEFISHDWLNHLYSAAYSAGYIGCAGGKTLDYEFKISELGAMLFNDGSGINMGRGLDRYNTAINFTKYTGYVSGCLMYMKRSILDKFGPLDTTFYPCYYEDSDWQYNLHLHGYKTIVNHKCEVLHKEGGSEKKTSISDFKLNCMNNNKQKLLFKYKNKNLEDYNA